MQIATKMPKRKLQIQDLLNAKIRIMSGELIASVAKDLNTSATILQDRVDRLDDISESSLPALSMERRIISETLSEHLKPIKEELSVKAYEIVRRADEIVLNKLNAEGESLELKDVVKVADSYEGRFARITGIEEHPGQGSSGQDRATRVNVYIENMFAAHNKKLSSDRDNINDIITVNPLTEDK